MGWARAADQTELGPRREPGDTPRRYRQLGTETFVHAPQESLQSQVTMQDLRKPMPFPAQPPSQTSVDFVPKPMQHAPAVTPGKTRPSSLSAATPRNLI